LYISGVARYNKLIWDVLALEGEREEAGERLCGAKLINSFPIRQTVPDGLARARFCCWACWARFFMKKKKSIIVNTIHIHLFYPFLWLKGGRNGWMRLDELG
jgi:hypothetical protein